MKVVVLVATVADTRYPLPGQRFSALGHPAAPAPARMLSPFDEAALETALKLRDADPATNIAVVLCEPAPADGLARAIAAHRPDALVRLDAAEVPLYDAVAASATLAGCVRAADADVVLLGREFGDGDDSALPAALAECLQFRYVGLAQAFALRDGRPGLVRESGPQEEWHPLGPGLVASVTNDRRSRLRHPLFKNVAAAKRAPLPERQSPPPCVPRVRLREVALMPASSRATQCRLLTGTPAMQAAALASYLQESLRT